MRQLIELSIACSGIEPPPYVAELAQETPPLDRGRDRDRRARDVARLMAKRKRTSPWSAVVACRSSAAWWQHHGDSYTRLPDFIRLHVAMPLLYRFESSFERFAWLDEEFQFVVTCWRLGSLLVVAPIHRPGTLTDQQVWYLAQCGRVLGSAFIIERNTPVHSVRWLREAVSGQAP